VKQRKASWPFRATACLVAVLALASAADARVTARRPLVGGRLRVLDLAGRHIHVLRTPGVGAGEPVWSRDGKRIVFVVANEGTDPGSIYSVRRDGRGRLLVFDGGEENVDPSWPSPGPSARGVAVTEIGWRYSTMPGRVATVRSRRTAQIVASEAFDPAWSPSGRVIVFSKADAIGTSLWSASPDGGDPRRIATAPAPFTYLGRCEFNRQGTRLACVAATEPLTPANNLPHDAHVVVLGAGGNGPVDLTGDSGFFEYGATWSPAGTRLALIRVTGDAARIVIVRAADGRQLSVLPERLDPGVYWRLSWSRAQQLALG
jgi:Tol biopolymer transport system component